MSHVLARLADRLVAQFVPAVRAHAASCRTVERFCYCRAGRRYATLCLVCDGSPITCKACLKTDTFCVGPY